MILCYDLPEILKMERVMRVISSMLLSLSLTIVACGDKEEDTVDTGTDTDTEDTDTEETDTEETDTEETDTEDSGDDTAEIDPLDSDDDGDGLSENEGDCDDTDPALNLADNDGDGVSSCDGDCDDGDSNIHPGAADDTDDGIDNDCDGDIDEDFVSGNETAIDNVAAGDLIITEIMNNPVSVDDELGEWFEIHNKTSAAIDLQGLVVSDEGSDTFTISSAVVIQPNGYAVVGSNSDTATNGGITVDYVFAHGTDMQLANGGDELILSNAGGVLDEVAWDGGPDFPDAGGYAMNLDPNSYDATANDDGSNWCYGTNPLASGDKGTPGTSNSACLPPPTWANDVQPLFSANSCTGCHAAQMPDLATLLTIQAGDYNSINAGASMPWVQPNSLGGSYLMRKLDGTHGDVGGAGGQMPQSGPLAPQDLDLVRMWILNGAQ